MNEKITVPAPVTPAVPAEENLNSLWTGLLNGLKKQLRERLGLISLIAIAVVAVFAGNYYYQYQSLLKNPQQAATKESKELLAAVSKLIILPEEEPTIATVADPEKLKDQAFFAHARKGDKVLIYPKARKAVLYSPESNKVVEVAPLTIGGGAPAK